MRRIRPSLAAAAALAVVPGIALLPALTSATPASAATSCTGTSLVAGMYSGGQVRVPTVGNGTGNWNCDLGLGNEGVAVERLQIALDYCTLHASLTVDGIYGPDTEQAVIAAQTYKDVPADGVYGPVTAKVLGWPVAGSNYTECDSIR
jgi:peptidoglycan hydrolase-like protein with peptidoglycan-binding domain